jgi:hypothetical protein
MAVLLTCNASVRAVSAFCGALLMIGPAAADTYAPPAWWTDGQPLDGDEGRAHFAEFQTICLATDASYDAIVALAAREGWTEGGPITSDGRVTGREWHYERGDRIFQVAAEYDPSFRGEPPLNGLPLHECGIQANASGDGGAIGSVMTMLHSSGCWTKDYPGYRTIAWDKRGPGYRLSYSFSRMGKEGSRQTDILLYLRIGNDSSFANLDRRNMC